VSQDELSLANSRIGRMGARDSRPSFVGPPGEASHRSIKGRRERRSCLQDPRPEPPLAKVEADRSLKG
jgi:hypothetical protein